MLTQHPYLLLGALILGSLLYFMWYRRSDRGIFPLILVTACVLAVLTLIQPSFWVDVKFELRRLLLD